MVFVVFVSVCGRLATRRLPWSRVRGQRAQHAAGRRDVLVHLRDLAAIRLGLGLKEELPTTCRSDESPE